MAQVQHQISMVEAVGVETEVRTSIMCVGLVITLASHSTIQLTFSHPTTLPLSFSPSHFPLELAHLRHPRHAGRVGQDQVSHSTRNDTSLLNTASS